MSQEENAQNHKTTLVPGFGQRFLAAFGDLKQSEIADLLNVQPSAITNYTKDRVPKPHILLKVWEHTKCDLHWLLTGEHVQLVENPPPPLPLENSEKKIIETLAQTTNQTVDQVLRNLLIEALEHRGLMKPRYSPAMLVLRPDIKLVAVPLIGSISAGQPIKYFKEHRNVMVAEIFLHDGYQHCVLEIVGDDVGWPNGDYVICCDNKHPESGSTVIAQIDGGPPTVKRIFFEGINIRLQPISNKSPGDLFPAETVEIIYTVTGVQHNP